MVFDSALSQNIRRVVRPLHRPLFNTTCQSVTQSRLINRNLCLTNIGPDLRTACQHRLFLRTTEFSSSKTKRDSGMTTTANYVRAARAAKEKKKKTDLRHLDSVSVTFNKIAKKAGFDSTTAFYADDSSFEDDCDFNQDELDLNTNDCSHPISDDSREGEEDVEEDRALDQFDAEFSSVSVSTKIERSSREVSVADMERLGFKGETNPFGDDETPRKDAFTLISNPMVCTACGSNFQSSDDLKPGYLPPEKYEIQVKLSTAQETSNILDETQLIDCISKDEIDDKIQSEEYLSTTCESVLQNIPLSDSKNNVICQRCHRLQNFGDIPINLRPGWTKEPLLSQDTFRELLLPLCKKKAVIIALVDLFDFNGSVLPELDSISGNNPIIVGVNKADLLPSAMGKIRAENWVRRELDYLGVKSIANVGGSVRLVSCKTGFGVDKMLTKARNLAEDLGADIYVIGAANSGKSTLINYILSKNKYQSAQNNFQMKRRAGNANARKDPVTASPLPGTTLKFIKVNIGSKQNLYDTPGLLIPGALTQRLTPPELKMVVPKKQVEPVSFRVASGKCVLVGGLAKIEIIGDSNPFLLTFFVSNDIKLHPTDSLKAQVTLQKHVGKYLTPPLEPGPERVKEIGEFEYHDVKIDGVGWKQAAADIALRGLGWVAITGVGSTTVRIGVPKGIGVSARPPLMPFDIWKVAAKYTGGRTVRKPTKSRSGKRGKGVGRR